MKPQSPQGIAINSRVILSATVMRLPATSRQPVATIVVEGVDQKITLNRDHLPTPLKKGDQVPVHGIVTRIDDAVDDAVVTIMLDGWDKPVEVPLNQVKPEV